jgi:signal transduction histidine kinase
LKTNAWLRSRSGQFRAGTIQTLHQDVVRLSEDVHALSYRLHPSDLIDFGLRAAIEAECDQFSKTYPIEVHTDLIDVSRGISHEVSLCFFRIAQEGLRNVARHAGATRVEISLRVVRDGLQLLIQDNGKGFDPKEPRGGIGLVSIRHRAELAGGTLAIESASGYGTRIVVWIPFTVSERMIVSTIASSTSRAGTLEPR